MSKPKRHLRVNSPVFLLLIGLSLALICAIGTGIYLGQSLVNALEVLMRRDTLVTPLPQALAFSRIQSLRLRFSLDTLSGVHFGAGESIIVKSGAFTNVYFVLRSPSFSEELHLIHVDGNFYKRENSWQRLEESEWQSQLLTLVGDLVLRFPDQLQLSSDANNWNEVNATTSQGRRVIRFEQQNFELPVLQWLFSQSGIELRNMGAVLILGANDKLPYEFHCTFHIDLNGFEEVYTLRVEFFGYNDPVSLVTPNTAP